MVDVIAILCSDIHLSLKPPQAREGEQDWFEAMAHPLALLSIARNFYSAPILCAGDIFDKWNSPPELINFALRNLPRMYAVPGQHDLPLHNYGDRNKSAFWTLVEAGLVTPLRPNKSEGITLDAKRINLTVHGFPWGFSIKEPRPNPHRLIIGIVHQYLWIDNHTYPGAPEKMKATKARKDFEGYDVLVFGDNHKGFLTTRGNTVIFNCGGLMRRAADEIDYQPQIGLLHKSGEVEVVLLDTTQDKIKPVGPTSDPVDDIKAPVDNMELQEFLNELTGLEETTLDFVEAMKRAIRKKKPSPEVRKILLEAME
ncbi:MAG: metallophosphoesterase family protein [Candidatus Marinimicrobia bacterium]|nr:metallophosphoesterase family protein [Candidatus Neomarinimicrobiota bacterium]